MSVKLNNDELATLYEEPGHIVKLYLYVRQKMDYATGIVGEKTKLSEAMFLDILNCMPASGRSVGKTPKFTRSAIRCAVERLEKIGLLKRIGPLVFECILADQDGCVQNTSSRPAARATAKKTQPKQLKNKENTKEQQPNLRTSNSQSPVSGNKNIIINNNILNIVRSSSINAQKVISGFWDFYNLYPRPEARIEAAKAYAKTVIKAGEGVIPLIQKGIENQREKLLKTDYKFRPLPATWINKGRWMDISKPEEEERVF